MTDVHGPEGMMLSGGAPASVPPAAPALTPRSPLRPRDTADLAAAVRDAASLGVPLRIRGAGEWLDAGRPVASAACTLDVSELRGIVEYNPGDLTLTARAGTRLSEIDAAARANGQWFPLDAAGGGRGTLGAALATASCGPLSGALGHPRDLALGLEFVDGRGIVVRGGGRVVKNVAGFDLVRLTIGAWGTLGVITEATVRLRARPESECTIVLDAPRELATLAELLRTLRDAPLAPLAMELVDGRRMAALGAGERDAVLLRLAGNPVSVEAQRSYLESLGAARELPAAAWKQLADGDPSGAFSLRVSGSPSRLAPLWCELAAALLRTPGAAAQASIDRGVARVVIPASASADVAPLVRAMSRAWRVIGERLPPPAWDALPPRTTDRLSQGVRLAFDPHHILNPGLLAPVA